MRAKIITLLVMTILFVGCTQPNPYNNSIIVAQKTPCLTCKVDLKRYK